MNLQLSSFDDKREVRQHLSGCQGVDVTHKLRSRLRDCLIVWDVVAFVHDYRSLQDKVVAVHESSHQRLVQKFLFRARSLTEAEEVIVPVADSLRRLHFQGDFAALNVRANRRKSEV